MAKGKGRRSGRVEGLEADVAERRPYRSETARVGAMLRIARFRFARIARFRFARVTRFSPVDDAPACSADRATEIHANGGNARSQTVAA